MKRILSFVFGIAVSNASILKAQSQRQIDVHGTRGANIACAEAIARVDRRVQNISQLLGMDELGNLPPYIQLLLMKTDYLKIDPVLFHRRNGIAGYESDVSVSLLRAGHFREERSPLFLQVMSKEEIRVQGLPAKALFLIRAKVSPSALLSLASDPSVLAVANNRNRAEDLARNHLQVLRNERLRAKHNKIRLESLVRFRDQLVEWSRSMQFSRDSSADSAALNRRMAGYERLSRVPSDEVSQAYASAGGDFELQSRRYERRRMELDSIIRKLTERIDRLR